MKRILVGLALAAAVLNGTLASAGSASLSASELQVDGVEMMAEGENIKIPQWLKDKIKEGVKWVWFEGVLWAVEELVAYFGPEENNGWYYNLTDPYTHQVVGKECRKIERMGVAPECVVD